MSSPPRLSHRLPQCSVLSPLPPPLLGSPPLPPKALSHCFHQHPGVLPIAPHSRPPPFPPAALWALSHHTPHSHSSLPLPTHSIRLPPISFPILSGGGAHLPPGSPTAFPNAAFSPPPPSWGSPPLPPQPPSFLPLLPLFTRLSPIAFTSTRGSFPLPPHLHNPPPSSPPPGVPPPPFPALSPCPSPFPVTTLVPRGFSHFPPHSPVLSAPFLPNPPGSLPSRSPFWGGLWLSSPPRLSHCLPQCCFLPSPPIMGVSPVATSPPGFLPLPPQSLLVSPIAFTSTRGSFPLLSPCPSPFPVTTLVPRGFSHSPPHAPSALCPFPPPSLGSPISSPISRLSPISHLPPLSRSTERSASG